MSSYSHCQARVSNCSLVVYLRLWEVTLSLGKVEFPALCIFNPLDAPVRLEMFLEDRGIKTFPFQLYHFVKQASC